MTTLETTTQTPFLNDNLELLFQQTELFVSSYQALAWLQQHGSAVLKPAGVEVVENLLGATAPERQMRGQLMLERHICAQATWVQLIELMAPAGRIEQLKKLVESLRRLDSSPEEYDEAKEAAVAALAEFSARQRDCEIYISQISQLAAEEGFMFSARRDLQDWQEHALDEVLKGKGLRQHPNTLKATAGRLEFLSKRYFGESPTRNGGGKSKGRSAKKAAKSARDKEIRRAMQQPKGAKPQAYGNR